LASPKKIQELQLSALAASRPNATLDIAKDIAAMVLRKKTIQSANVASRLTQRFDFPLEIGNS
jgi:hypothetical protein